MPDRNGAFPACPECGATTVVRIAYGLPSEQGMERARRGEIVLGGCVVRAGAPMWLCRVCGQRFGDVMEGIPPLPARPRPSDA